MVWLWCSLECMQPKHICITVRFLSLKSSESESVISHPPPSRPRPPFLSPSPSPSLSAPILPRPSLFLSCSLLPEHAHGLSITQSIQNAPYQPDQMKPTNKNDDVAASSSSTSVGNDRVSATVLEGGPRQKLEAQSKLTASEMGEKASRGAVKRFFGAVLSGVFRVCLSWI